MAKLRKRTILPPAPMRGSSKPKFGSALAQTAKLRKRIINPPKKDFGRKKDRECIGQAAQRWWG